MWPRARASCRLRPPSRVPSGSTYYPGRRWLCSWRWRIGIWGNQFAAKQGSTPESRAALRTEGCHRKWQPGRWFQRSLHTLNLTSETFFFPFLLKLVCDFLWTRLAAARAFLQNHVAFANVAKPHAREKSPESLNKWLEVSRRGLDQAAAVFPERCPVFGGERVEHYSIFHLETIT